MGVYIKGMEMPKKQPLIIKISQDGIVYISQGIYGIGHGVATAVSVPPHGRLIDADALIATIRPVCDEDAFAACTFETVKRLMVEHINAAPTAIEKEEVYSQYTDTAGNFHWCGTHSGEHTIKAEEKET